MATRKTNRSIQISNAMFWFAAIWSIFQFAVCMLDFFRINNWHIPEHSPMLYFLVLISYTAKKEVDRWRDFAWAKRKGEYFLIVWFAPLMPLLVIQVVSHGYFAIPWKMVETLIAVTIAYVVRKYSQLRYTKLSKRNCAKKTSVSKS